MNHLTEIKIELWKRGNYELLGLSKKQEQAIKYLVDSETKEILYGGAVGGGKSWLGAMWVVMNCLAYPGTKWFIGRKSIKDLDGSVSVTINKVCKFLKIDQPKYNGKLNWFTFENGSQIDYKECRYRPEDKLYERLGSIEYTGGWIEEGGEVPFKSYDKLKTRIGRHLNLNFCHECGKYHEAPEIKKNEGLLYCKKCQKWVKGICSKILTTCNPKKNWMYKLFYLPWKDKTLHKLKVFIQAFIGDNDWLGKDYVDNLINTDDKSEKQRLLYGNWEYDDDPNWLIKDYDTLLDVFKNHHVTGVDRYITCDAARFGSDKAIILVWEGWKVMDSFTFDISETTDISDKIKEFQKKYHIANRHTIVDSDGVGGGVVDQVKCKGFVNHSKAIFDKDDKNYGKGYNSLKDQCGFILSYRINASELYINAPSLSITDIEDIKEEIEQLKRVKTDKKQKLMNKDDIKELIHRSPDWLDSLLMRSYFDLKKRKSINY